MNLDRLVELYNRMSKHSQYQVLAAPLRCLISNRTLKTHSRFEQERLEFILNHVTVAGSTFADIGGNTGFFTIELINRSAHSVLFIDGNQEHCDFVAESIDILGWQNRVLILPHYLRFDDDLAKINVNICLLLNVLHHVGSDYGGYLESIEAARKSILDSLTRLSNYSKFLILQLGFNWKGDKKLPLFEKGTKQEMIEFVESGTRGTWKIKNIGIAERASFGIAYKEVNPSNIKRDNSLGEFLNRPIFIMESINV